MLPLSWFGAHAGCKTVVEEANLELDVCIAFKKLKSMMIKNTEARQFHVMLLFLISSTEFTFFQV